MKNKVKVIGIISLMIFSFYYTEKAALYVQDNTPLKKEIYTFKESNEYKPLDATIKKDTIIPGISAEVIDVNKSYENMKKENKFDKNKIIYKKEKPKVSVINNMDKIIISGNNYKKGVSIIINKGDNYYYDKYKIKYNYIDDSKFCINKTDNCEHMFKIKTSLEINNMNFLSKVEKIKSGDILYINDNLNEKYISMLIKRINFLNLKIYNLDEHIKE